MWLLPPGDFVIPGHHDGLFGCDRLDAGQALCAGRAGGVEQGAYDALPLPGFEFGDCGVEVGQQLADVALDIAFDLVGPDLVPVGAFYFDDDQHFLFVVGDDCQVDSSAAARGQPPSALPESGRTVRSVKKADCTVP